MTLAVAAALALSLAAAPRAHAQSDEGDRERALELFDQGVEAYRQGDFERSAELMQQAYGLHEEPLLLYNLARAQEQIGQTEEAIANYEEYLEKKPDAEDRGAVERRLEILRERLAEERAQEQAGSDRAGASTPGAASDPAPATPQDAPPDDGESPSVAPWILAGGGVAVVGVGSIFGVLANKAHDDAVDDPVHRSASASADDADRWALLANVTFGIGAAVAVAGVVWGIVDIAGSGDEGETAVSLRVGPASVGVEGRF